MFDSKQVPCANKKHIVFYFSHNHMYETISKYISHNRSNIQGLQPDYKC